MVHSTRRFVVCLSVCRFVLVFFGLFGVAVASLVGRRGGGEWEGVGGGSGRRLVCLFGLYLFRFVGFLFLLGGGGGGAVCDCGTPWTFLLPFLK